MEKNYNRINETELTEEIKRILKMDQKMLPLVAELLTVIVVYAEHYNLPLPSTIRPLMEEIMQLIETSRSPKLAPRRIDDTNLDELTKSPAIKEINPNKLSKHSMGTKMLELSEIFNRMISCIDPKARGFKAKILQRLFEAACKGGTVKPGALALKVGCSEMTVRRTLGWLSDLGIAKRMVGNRWRLSAHSLTSTLTRALQNRLFDFKRALAYAQVVDNTMGLHVDEPLPAWYDGMVFGSDNENGVIPAHSAAFDESGKILTLSDKAGTKDNKKHIRRCPKNGLFQPFSAIKRFFEEFNLPLSYSLAPFPCQLSLNGGF